MRWDENEVLNSIPNPDDGWVFEETGENLLDLIGGRVVGPMIEIVFRMPYDLFYSQTAKAKATECVRVVADHAP
jgi:hypothetical protein